MDGYEGELLVVDKKTLDSEDESFRGVHPSLMDTYKTLEEDLMTDQVLEAAASYRPYQQP